MQCTAGAETGSKITYFNHDFMRIAEHLPELLAFIIYSDFFRWLLSPLAFQVAIFKLKCVTWLIEKTAYLSILWLTIVYLFRNHFFEFVYFSIDYVVCSRTKLNLHS